MHTRDLQDSEEVRMTQPVCPKCQSSRLHDWGKRPVTTCLNCCRTFFRMSDGTLSETNSSQLGLSGKLSSVDLKMLSHMKAEDAGAGTKGHTSTEEGGTK